VDADCTDGQFCNGAETCDAIAGCLPGLAPPLDDGVLCTLDVCDEAGDEVTHTPVDADCTDGQFCNGAESCDAQNGCQAGLAPTLDDSVACTLDACDETADVVTHTPVDADCDDSQFCNGSETCNATEGCQDGTPPICEDGINCTADSCAEGVGCTFEPVNSDCDDGLFCNGVEECDAQTGCAQGPPPDLSDGIDCTDDTCDEAGGVALHTPNNTLCPAGGLCTSGLCSTTEGCISALVPEDTPCDDGEACIVQKSCLAGTCQGGISCEDNGQICSSGQCVGGGTATLRFSSLGMSYDGSEGGPQAVITSTPVTGGQIENENGLQAILTSLWIILGGE
jgi:hypothetical protein